MLTDEVWLSIHPQGSGMLCMSCCEARLGRDLAFSDIEDCPLTRYGNPYTAYILNTQCPA